MKKAGTTKAKERQKKRAQSILDRMRPLGPGDPPDAHRIKAELEKIAEHGYERNILSRSSRCFSKAREETEKEVSGTRRCL